MADLIEEVSLPSEGKIYNKDIKWENRIRAPRLCDKGIGDMSHRLRIQCEVLKRTLIEDLGIDPYDLHTSDFTYLNLRQRMVARGKDMDLILNCPHCGKQTKITVDLSQIKINKPKLPLDLTYETRSGDTVQLTYFTPRILDSIRDNIEKFKENFPEATQDIDLQETCRALILTVNGQKKSYSQMTSFLLDSYEVDLIDMIDKAAATNFGPVLIQKGRCSNSKCKKLITFTVSPDQG